MTVAPILPPNASVPAPPASTDDLLSWARRVTKAIGDLYSLLARRADSVLTHGLAADLPAPVGSRRLYVATDTGDAHYDAGIDIIIGGGSTPPVGSCPSPVAGVHSQQAVTSAGGGVGGYDHTFSWTLSDPDGLVDHLEAVDDLGQVVWRGPASQTSLVVSEAFRANTNPAAFDAIHNRAVVAIDAVGANGARGPMSGTFSLETTGASDGSVELDDPGFGGTPPIFTAAGHIVATGLVFEGGLRLTHPLGTRDLGVVPMWDGNQWRYMTPESGPALGSSYVVQADTFTASGSADFTATGTPLSGGTIVVAVNGMVQPTTAWSVTDAVLTFVVAPEGGQLVTWTYYTQAPAGSNHAIESLTASGSEDFTVANTIADVLVLALNGLVQSTASWSLVSPSTIHFPAAPSLGSIVTVSYRLG